MDIVLWLNRAYTVVVPEHTQYYVQGIHSTSDRVHTGGVTENTQYYILSIHGTVVKQSIHSSSARLYTVLCTGQGIHTHSDRVYTVGVTEHHTQYYVQGTVATAHTQ